MWKWNSYNNLSTIFIAAYHSEIFNFQITTLLILNWIDDKRSISLRTTPSPFFNEINPPWAVTFSRIFLILGRPTLGQLTSGLRTFMQMWIAHRNTSKYAKCMQSINVCKTEINCAIFYVTSGIFLLFRRCYESEIKWRNLQIFR